MVGLMANSADNGDLRVKDCRCDGFFIEGPKIFQTSSPTSYNENIGELELIKLRDGLGDLSGCTLSLDLDGIENEMEFGKAASENMQYVLDHRAGGRGHNPDGLRVFRKSLFACFIKPATLLEFYLHFMQLQEKFSDTGIRELANDDLIISSRGIDIDFAFHDNSIPIFWDTGKSAGIAFEKNGRDLGLSIF